MRYFKVLAKISLGGFMSPGKVTKTLAYLSGLVVICRDLELDVGVLLKVFQLCPVVGFRLGVLVELLVQLRDVQSGGLHLCLDAKVS